MPQRDTSKAIDKRYIYIYGSQMIGIIQCPKCHTGTQSTSLQSRELSTPLYGERFSYLSMSIQTLAIHWSMYQTGHDPHGYNPVTIQHHYTGRDIVYLCQYRNQLINVLYQDTIHRATITWLINATTQGSILLAIDTNTDNQWINTKVWSPIVYFNENQITSNTVIKAESKFILYLMSQSYQELT